MAASSITQRVCRKSRCFPLAARMLCSKVRNECNSLITILIVDCVLWWSNPSRPWSTVGLFLEFTKVLRRRTRIWKTSLPKHQKRLTGRRQGNWRKSLHCKESSDALILEWCTSVKWYSVWARQAWAVRVRNFIYHLLTESGVIRGKSQTEAQMYWPSDIEVNMLRPRSEISLLWQNERGW